MGVKIQTFYAMIRRIDGGEFHAATIDAMDQAQAARSYAPDYGCGIRFTTTHPQARKNIRAVHIIATSF